MNWDLLGAAALFGLVVAGTPGPANLSLMTMGATVGFRRSQRYLMGIWAGGLAVTALVGLGVGALLQAEPVIYRALQLAGFFYICWLAWQLAGMTGSGRTEAAQPSFWAGAVLHPINPKAYVMNVTAFASFTTPGMAYGLQAVMTGVTLALVMIFCTTSWTLGGDVLRHWLTQARYAAVLRRGLAVAMVASVGVPMLLS